jgi:translocation protein SEC63
MLAYDDAAFFYFFTTVLLVYLVPASFLLGKKAVGVLLCDRPGPDDLTEARTREEELTVAKIQAAKRRANPLKHPCYLIHCTVVILLWFSVVWMTGQLKVDGQIEQFDPFAILELESGADTKAIRKAYRRLSLKYHPDKNPGDGMANEKFMMVARAHEALTDEEAKANFEKFGNPDGRQSLEVSIGLPSFLLEKENHTSILLVYLLCLVVLIPLVVWCWYSNSKQYGERNVMENTYRQYAYFLKQETPLKTLPEIFAASQEFQNLPLARTGRAQKELQTYAARFQRSKEMAKPKRFTLKAAQRDPRARVPFGNNVLLHAHLMGLPLCAENQAVVDAMLEKMPRLLEAMVFVSTLVGRRMWTTTAVAAIRFSQLLTQGLWLRSSSLEQLPHFGEREASHCLRGRKKGKDKTGGGYTVRDFILTEPSQRKGLSQLDDWQVREVERVCAAVPVLEVDARCSVLDEEEIAEQDLVTLTVKITRTNVAEDGRAPPVFAPRFPVQRRESFWVLFSLPDSPRLIAIAQVAGQERTVQTEIKFRAPAKAGKYAFEVQVLSDSYMGCDRKVRFEMDVVPLDSLPKYEAHPDDLALDYQPTLFDMVQNGGMMPGDDTDSEDEDEDDAVELTEAQRKRREARLVRRRTAREDGDTDTGTDTDDDPPELVDGEKEEKGEEKKKDK